MHFSRFLFWIFEGQCATLKVICRSALCLFVDDYSHAFFYSHFGILYFVLHKKRQQVLGGVLPLNLYMFKVNIDPPSFIFFLFRANWRKGRPSM
jgi:hypothetical protein